MPHNLLQDQLITFPQCSEGMSQANSTSLDPCLFESLGYFHPQAMLGIGEGQCTLQGFARFMTHWDYPHACFTIKYSKAAPRRFPDIVGV